ncbi:tripartite ATP-independent transporter DctP family solute receptor [Actinoplanes tereljensis]|uniref:TRAP transporter substrate-binding protein n=1 Tax=Paractinoplanes tereljensis TaxID=571912 RepID=UPI00194042B7|nr:TRAP transporter substrate-binding protein [Actinoplanes tereljensis]
MNRRSVLSLSLAVTAAGLSACSRPRSGGGGSGATTIRLGDDVAEDNPEIAAERWFGDQVKSLTGGKYEVKVFPNATLGDSNRMNEQVRSGTLQMSKSLFSNLTAFDKRLGVLSLPYAFPKPEDGFTALAGPLGDECKKILDGVGLTVLSWFYTGTRNVYNTKRPVHAAADLKGLRLRVPQNPVTVDSFNALGAQATPLPATEIYSALQQGVIDGAENNPIYYVSSKQVEEAKHWSWTRHQLGVDVLMVSKKFFADQPADVQDALVQAGKLTQDHERELWNAQTDIFVKKAQDAGATSNDDVDVASMQTALKPVFDKYRPTFGDLMKLLPVA